GVLALIHPSGAKSHHDGHPLMVFTIVEVISVGSVYGLSGFLAKYRPLTSSIIGLLLFLVVLAPIAELVECQYPGWFVFGWFFFRGLCAFVLAKATRAAWNPS